MNKTSIEWTHRPETGGAAGGFTWNPIRARLKVCPDCGHKHDLTARTCWQLQDIEGGTRRCLCETKQTGTFCTRISPGCTHCYASTINKRFGNGLEFTVPNLEKVEFFIDEKILEEPLRRKKPATIFVGDMFDLFHEAIPQEMVAEVLRVAWKLPRHTFQFLTKRAERMRRLVNAAQEHWSVEFGEWMWFGASVESQPYADARIPELFQTRCAVRFLSVEPMLEAVDLHGPRSMAMVDCGEAKCSNHSGLYCPLDDINWVICGGESGPGARPFNLAWAESLLEQCRAAGVPFFMKQVGGNPVGEGLGTAKVHHGKPEARYAQGSHARVLWDSKGGTMSEWPEHLRVREFPAEKLVPVEAGD